MKGVFPVDFEAPSSSRFRTITSQKNAAEVAKQSRNNIMRWELLCFLGENGLDIALLYKYIWWWAMFFSGAEKVFKKPATADPMFFF